MTSLEELTSIASKLSNAGITVLLENAKSILEEESSSKASKRPKRQRNFAPRPACPYCSSDKVVLDGTQRSKQRNWCKSCNRSFVPTTNTIMSGSHYTIDNWKSMIEDTFEFVSLDDSAAGLGISHQTAFSMRHKILLALMYLEDQEPTTLKVLGELDETYVLESEKGKKFMENAKREPRKRGEKATKRGLSDEQICICTGVERNKGDSYAVTVNRAKPSKAEIKEAFDGHIAEGTVLYTDGLKGYDILEESTDCKVNGVTVEEMKKTKTATLNNVNSFHAFIKGHYHDYRGVASKYINRYNALFSAGFRNRRETIDKVCQLVLTLRPDDMHMTDEDVRDKGPIR